MAKALPIEVTSVVKRGLADESRFFRLLSEENNYVDHKTVRNFYEGLVRVVKQELRENGAIRLPELGDFALITQKAHMGLVGDKQGIIPESRVLKFIPKEALRKFFRLLDGYIAPEVDTSGLPDEYRVEQ